MQFFSAVLFLRRMRWKLRFGVGIRIGVAIVIAFYAGRDLT
jgi:hypothetical protein